MLLDCKRKDRKRMGLSKSIGTFNKANALVGAFSMIVKLQTSRRFVSSSNRNTVRGHSTVTPPTLNTRHRGGDNYKMLDGVMKG